MTRAEYLKKWRRNNPTKKREYEKKYRRKLKIDIFTHYGGAFCCCCGEDELAFLSLDHINDDGALHKRELVLRKEMPSRVGGTPFYQWLKNNNYPPGFQVLCLNCNRAKHDLGICPHKKVEESKWIQETLF